MKFLKSTVEVCGLTRILKIGSFADDEAEDLKKRYFNRIGKGVAAAIFSRLLEMASKEGLKVTLNVSVEPFGEISEVTSAVCSKENRIEDIESLCENLSVLSIKSLRSWRKL